MEILTGLGLLLLGLIVGYVLALIFDSPSKRAIAKLELIVSQEESRLRNTVHAFPSRFSNEFANGTNHVIGHFKEVVRSLKGR